MLPKNPKAVLGFDDRLYVIFGIILNTQTVMAIYYTGAFFKVKFSDYLLSWFSEFLIISILWFAIRSLYIHIAKKFRGFINVRKRLAIIPFFLIPYLIICFLYLEYVKPFFNWDYAEFPEPSILVKLVTGAIILYANLGFYECIFLILELKNTKLKQERMISENVTSQLINLKNQISPHFLFNSLNTLVHLIDTNKEKSKEFVHKLANVYQNTLEISEQNLVSLKEELTYINAYASLLQERFGSNLNFKIDIPNDVERKKVIPLSLQLAVENAVKHNIITKKKPLSIAVETENNYLVISNNIQKKPTDGINYGLGLKNITKRYELITERQVIIENGNLDFVLKLPLLEE